MTETGHPIEVEMLICYHVGKINQAAKFDENFKPSKKKNWFRLFCQALKT